MVGKYRRGARRLGREILNPSEIKCVGAHACIYHPSRRQYFKMTLQVPRSSVNGIRGEEQEREWDNDVELGFQRTSSRKWPCGNFQGFLAYFLKRRAISNIQTSQKEHRMYLDGTCSSMLKISATGMFVAWLFIKRDWEQTSHWQIANTGVDRSLWKEKRKTRIMCRRPDIASVLNYILLRTLASPTSIWPPVCYTWDQPWWNLTLTSGPRFLRNDKFPMRARND